MSVTYAFFIGSTSWFRARQEIDRDNLTWELSHILGFKPELVTIQGVWEGGRETTAQLFIQCCDNLHTNASLGCDARMQRIAHSIAVLTNNDVVLLNRKITDTDKIRTFMSARSFFASIKHTNEGNRTLYPTSETDGWSFEVDKQNPTEVVWLVWLKEAQVTPVNIKLGA